MSFELWKQYHIITLVNWLCLEWGSGWRFKENFIPTNSFLKRECNWASTEKCIKVNIILPIYLCNCIMFYCTILVDLDFSFILAYCLFLLKKNNNNNNFLLFNRHLFSRTSLSFFLTLLIHGQRSLHGDFIKI